MKKRSDPQKTLLMVAGGTSGHIYPALAIAAAVKENLPSVRLVFCGVADSLEEKMVKREGYDFRPIQAQNMPSRQDRRYWGWLVRNTRGLFMGFSLLRKLKPQLVMGTGGFVSAPVLAAARFKRIPYMLHEQNSVPGRTNRMFAPKARTVFISYEVSRRHFAEKDQLVFSGNPVRPDFFDLDRQKAREVLGIGEDIFLVLVMGGSLGARTLNTAVSRMDDQGDWSELLARQPQLRMSVSVGVQSQAGCAEASSELPGILRAESFFLDAPSWIAACDLFIGRAGAMTCAEIAAQAKPSILIPFPFAADDHQTENARAMEEAGAALVIKDGDFDSHSLLTSIESMMEDPDRLALMGQKAGQWATPKAADRIAEGIAAAMTDHETPKP